MSLPDAAYEAFKRGAAQARYMRQQRYPDSISIDTWLGGFRWLFPDQRSEKAKWEELSRLAPFRKRYGSRRVAEFTAIQAQDWALKHPPQVPLLRNAWKYAVLMGVAPLNVWQVVVLPKQKKRLVVPPSDERLAEILMRSRTRGLEAPWWDSFADMIEVAAFTGARQAGLLGLRLGDIDLDQRRMTLTEKGTKTRTVVLPTRAFDALERQLARHGSEFSRGPLNPHVFVAPWPAWDPKPPVWEKGRAGAGRWIGGESRPPFPGPLKAAHVQACWKRVRGDYAFGWHGLRHYATTWMRAAGLDPLDVAQQLGHTDSEGRPYVRLVERRYDHPDPEPALRRLSEQLQ